MALILDKGVNYSKEIHNLRKQYSEADQQWIRDRLDTLITKIAEETDRSKDVEVSVYINDNAHVIGKDNANKIAIVLRNKMTEKNPDGIESAWTFKTIGKYLKDLSEEALEKVHDAVKYFWDGIVKILQGVREDAVAAAGEKLAITSA